MNRRSFFTFISGIVIGSRIPLSLESQRLISYPIQEYAMAYNNEVILGGEAHDIFIEEFSAKSIQRKMGSVKFLTLDTMLGIC